MPRADAARGEFLGNPMRASHQLRAREGPARVRHRGRIRHPSRLQLHPLMEKALTRPVLPRVVPINQHLARPHLVEQARRVHGVVRCGGQPRGQRGEGLGEARSELLREQRRAGEQHASRAVGVRREVELHVELAEVRIEGVLHALHSGQPERARGVLHAKEDLEQRAARRVPLLPGQLHELLEGHTLVLGGLERMAVDVANQLRELDARGHLVAHHQRVHQAADEWLQAAISAVGVRRAHHHVSLAAEALQRHHEHREQRREWGRAHLLGHTRRAPRPPRGGRLKRCCRPRSWVIAGRGKSHGSSSEGRRSSRVRQ